MLFKQAHQDTRTAGKTLEGRRLKLDDTHPHTLESWNNLIDLYEAWNKPEETKKWRAQLVQIEDFKE